MNTYKSKLAALLAAAILLVCSYGAAAAESQKLVSVDWLAENLETPNVVVLSVGAFTQYEKNHIPGAVKAFGPWQTMNDEYVGFMMPKVNDLVSMLRSYGVNNDSYVILYDEGVTAQDTAKSARALWTLEALGHDKVAILNGGFAAWTQAGKAVSTEPVVAAPGNFSGELAESKLATKAEVKKAVEAIFGVKVESVHTMNRVGKSRRTRFGTGRRKDTKRAVVTLREGSIDIFGTL